MPRTVDRVAPARAPATRAESMVARETLRAPTRWAGGIVSPMRALRITWSLGRTMPASIATAEHPGRREHAGEGQDHQERGEGGEGRAHRAEHDPAAEAIAEHAEHRRGQGAQLLQRGEDGEEQHRAGVDHHVPAEDERLHLERPRGEEIGGHLEAEAADAERRGDQWPSAPRRRGARPACRLRDRRSAALDAEEPAGPPSIATRSASVRPGVPRMWSTEVFVHGNGIVGAHDDLAGPGLRHQVAQRLGREDDRVVVELRGGTRSASS